jgi:hypothetical protein
VQDVVTSIRIGWSPIYLIQSDPKQTAPEHPGAIAQSEPGADPYYYSSTAALPLQKQFVELEHNSSTKDGGEKEAKEG